MTPSLYALGSVIFVSLVSLLGLFTISMKERRLRSILFSLVALAIGSLLGDAFVHLIPESFEMHENSLTVSAMIIAGILFFFIIEKLLNWHHHHSDEDDMPQNTIMPIGKLILVSDGLHNFVDGIIIGVSYLAGIQVGIATTLAIILHEIPQEIGDFAILLHAGYSRNRALLLNFFSALSALLGTIIVLALGDMTERIVAWILPFAAGSLLYIAMSDLVPELHKRRGLRQTAIEIIWISVGILAMFALRTLE